MRANSPLVILSPRTRELWAWAICGTLGGGLVAGDDICLDVAVGKDAAALIGTQASTKVYRSMGGKNCRQEISAIVEDNGLLILLPDPVCCFAGSVYRQHQRIDLIGSGSAVLLDWFTSGRSACGERWQMQSYTSRTDIFVDGRQTLRDATHLDSADGCLNALSRLGRFDCSAVLMVVGGHLATAARALLEWAAQAQILETSGVLFSAAPVREGVILRVAGPSTQLLGKWLRKRLTFLEEFGMHDPWMRRN
jgi:urease accessory protein